MLACELGQRCIALSAGNPPEWTPMLDLVKLETFRTVANTGSFTRAGSELGYSQSTITAHIQALEREFGAPLFERARFSREIALTEIGQRTLDYAGRLLALAQETAIAIHTDSEPGGQLRVSVNALLLAYRFPRMLRKYQMTYSQVRLTIASYTDPRAVVATALNGAADVAFVFGEATGSERVIAEKLGSDRLLVVCSPDHPLARFQKTGALAEDLARNQFFTSDASCAVRLHFERFLTNEGFHMDETTDAGSIEAVKRCAAEGMGFGFMPSFAVTRELSARELIAVPIRNADLRLEIQMVRNAKTWVSPALRAFWEMARPDFVLSSAA
ncbi:MAG TPA: LysR family transcriptional regulator [Bryobacteraceae bacterium]|nr:LysR family transcriptional regulator [Bryobacteraceae bacterium]